MNIADIVVAELRKSMKSAIPQIIPQIIGFLSTENDSLRKAVAEALSILSQEGSTSCFLA